MLNQPLSTAIHSALGYWLEKDYQCPNWWHNEIGVPRNLGSILIVLGDEITPAGKGIKAVLLAG